MEAEQIPSDTENVVMSDAEKPVVDGAGDAGPALPERIRRKNRKHTRSTSKETSSPMPLPRFRSWKNSRRPRNGHGRGLPKKGGAGGKGVWGIPGSELMEEYVEDINDPNYDPVSNGDVEFKQVIVNPDPEEITRKSVPVILEYFEHGDTDAALEEFLAFVSCSRSQMVCETIVETAMNHKPSHCEMASVLISDLYGRLFSIKDIEYAFERLLDRLPDLAIDTPDAVTLISNFIARCIADDCLPPKFVKSQDLAQLNDHAKQTLVRAETLLSMKQGLVRLDNIWGVGGGIRAVAVLIRQIQLLLKEYLTSNDLSEAIRCVRELEVPHFHHEIVYETILLAFDTVNSTVEEQLSVLLAELSRSFIVTPDQMEQGFIRVLEDMNDIVIDVPLAYIMLDRFVERCSHKFRISERVKARMPSRGRKRFVSEGDGGAIKDHAIKLRD